MHTKPMHRKPRTTKVATCALNHVCRGMQLGNFEYTAVPLALGASGGNQFELTLRHVDGATTDQVRLMHLHSMHPSQRLQRPELTAVATISIATGLPAMVCCR